MDFLGTRVNSPGSDPALLAFVKCHVTSFLRWDVIRLLTAFGDRWTDPEEVAHTLRKPGPVVEETLRGLQSEGLLEVRWSPSGASSYRMPPQEPSSRVAERLVSATTRSWELRQIIVAHIVGQTHASA